MLDGKAFGEEIVGIVRGYVDRTVTPLAERVAAVEAREIPTAIKGDPGEVGTPGEAGLPGVDGRDGVDGKDGAPGVDGKDADPEAITNAVLERVEARLSEIVPLAVGEAVASLPVPERGEKGEPGDTGAPGEKGLDGKDGVGLVDVIPGRDGLIVLTMSDGRTKELSGFGPAATDEYCPDDTGLMVARAIKMMAEVPDLKIYPTVRAEPVAQIKDQPVVVNVHPAGSLPAKPVHKTITMRRHPDGTEYADVVETSE